VLIAVTLGLTVGAGSAAASVAASLRIPAGWRVAGVVVMWLGS
jgi:hypothetical protein